MLRRYLRRSLGIGVVVLALLTTSLWSAPVKGAGIDPRPAALERRAVVGIDDLSPPKGGGLRNDPSWLLPDLQTLPPHDLRLLVSQGGQRKLLRFANTVWNSGPGPLELRGQESRPEKIATVAQIVYRINGATAGRVMGELVFHPEHGHWHWDDFSIYQVWSIDSDGSPDRLLASSGKVGYCSLDHRRIETFLSDADQPQVFAGPERAQYHGCSWQIQGISVGWTDTYRQNLPDQVIDISSLTDGVYILLSTVNPRRRLLEADLDNNTGRLYFELQEDRLIILE